MREKGDGEWKGWVDEGDGMDEMGRMDVQVVAGWICFVTLCSGFDRCIAWVQFSARTSKLSLFFLHLHFVFLRFALFGEIGSLRVLGFELA